MRRRQMLAATLANLEHGERTNASPENLQVSPVTQDEAAELFNVSERAAPYDSHVGAWRDWRHSQARQFLARLDPEAERFTFQTFDDDKKRKLGELAKVKHSEFDSIAAWLDAMQEWRAGVFVTINETDFTGRQAHNVERVRAVFVDLDGAPLAPVLAAGLEPHIVVESSPGRYHVYWLTDDCPLDQFVSVQEALARRFSGDKNVKDLSRVMRLPGFRHFKAEAQTCKLLDGIGTTAPPYALAEIVGTLKLELDAKEEHKGAPQWAAQASPSQVVAQDVVVELRSALASLPADDRAEWVAAAHALHALGDVGRGLWEEWSQKSAKYDPEDAARVWSSIRAAERTGYAAVFKRAQERGWANPRSRAARDFEARDAPGWQGAPPHDANGAHGAASHRAEPEGQPERENATAGAAEASTWPDAMDPAALHGIAGEFARMIEPNTEADPAAILVQFLVAFGALVGRGPHYRVEGDQHHANLFVILVGSTSKARKGTSWGRVREAFERIPDWKPHVSGLSSGEGLKYHVRDAREETKPNKNGELVTEVTDEGVTDKRLFVVEPEFASALRVVQRQGNTLSATVREAWDSGNLRTLTKHDPVTATGAHVCSIGHITADELRAELTATDTANGFANRFLFVAVKRSKLLPFGGDQADEGELQAFADRLRERGTLARTRHQLGMSEATRAVWKKVYPELSAGGGGLHGAVTARAEAQVVRLALIYCLLDGADRIDVPHLLAALAIWQYCDATAKHIFGSSLGDRAADEIMRRLRLAGDGGMTRTEIRDIFGRNLSAERIGAALALLQRRGRATCETVSTGGRPSELWRATK